MYCIINSIEFFFTHGYGFIAILIHIFSYISTVSRYMQHTTLYQTKTYWIWKMWYYILLFYSKIRQTQCKSTVTQRRAYVPHGLIWRAYLLFKTYDSYDEANRNGKLGIASYYPVVQKKKKIKTNRFLFHWLACILQAFFLLLK